MAGYYYEKLDENLEPIRPPQDDKDGSVTGRIVMNVRAWFDENPEERKRLGWIKHITHEDDEIPYNRQTQFLSWSVAQIDPYTVEDVYHIMDKSEEQLLYEDMMGAQAFGGFVFY